MRVFLVGYPGSKKILRASSYLVKKYLPNSFEINYLNFGNFKESNLNGCNYLKLGNLRLKGIDSWSSYMFNVLKDLDDEYIIFSLDDYFLSKKLNIFNFNFLLKKLKNNEEFISGELSISPEEKYSEQYSSDGIYVYEDTYSFTVNTQWRIWNREFLLEIFERTTHPWSFEIEGSKYLNKSQFKSISHCSSVLNYPEISALSKRNKNKISVLGNQDEDIKDLIDFGYLQEKDLVLGQWKKGVPSYREFKENQHEIIKLIEDEDEKRFYKLMLDKCLH